MSEEQKDHPATPAKDAQDVEKPGFYNDIFPEETREISARRVLSDPGNQTLKNESTPTTDNGLIGLALSGGGIRSATFSLGVVQGLLKKKVFRFMDYISTVSGGGYLGSCISSILNGRKDTESLFHSKDDAETVKHLRNNSNYLTPPGVLNKLRLPLVVIRGIFLNLFLLLPLIIGAVILTEVVNELFYPYMFDFNRLKIYISTLIGIIMLLFLFYPFAMKAFREKWKKRDQFELYMSRALGLILFLLVMSPVLKLVSHVANFSISEITGYISYFFSQPSVIIGTSVIAAVVILLFFTKLRITLIRIIVGLLGPLIVFSLYLFTCIHFIESPYIHKRYRTVIEKIARSDTQTVNLNAIDVSTGEGKTMKAFVMRLENQKLIEPSAKTINITGKDKTWTVRIDNDNEKTFTIEDKGKYLYIPDCSMLKGYLEWELYLWGLGLLLFNFFFLDINTISMHGFYRDRLSLAYLFKDGADGIPEQNDRQKLSNLNKPKSCAPYHLINTALNVPGSSDRDLRGRNTEFFTFSKHYCGSDITGYCQTTEIEAKDRHMNLGTAMAISAAAAAPSMGTQKLSQFAFIMTLLNVRLNYWVPNPSFILGKKYIPQFTGPRYLMKEAVRSFNEKTRKVNLSDGGHIENLAIYQLLKRRCKLIIAVDGEADPNMRFKGLSTLIRYASIDQGIDIHIDLEPLRKDDKGLSKRQWTMGEIDYPADSRHGLKAEKGILLYIKLSLKGDEAEFINAYRRENPAYPHQSTADQFFDETQFEVYRALGEKILDDIFHGDEIRATVKDSKKFIEVVEHGFERLRELSHDHAPAPPPGKHI